MEVWWKRHDVMLTDWTPSEACPDSLGFLLLSVGKTPSERRTLSPSRQGRLEKGRARGLLCLWPVALVFTDC